MPHINVVAQHGTLRPCIANIKVPSNHYVWNYKSDTMTIEYPFITEKATVQLEEDNKLQFVVDVNATKDRIKNKIEEIYGFEVASVRTMITPKGEKKAIVTFVEDDAANELATRIGLF